MNYFYKLLFKLLSIAILDQIMPVELSKSGKHCVNKIFKTNEISQHGHYQEICLTFVSRL